MNIFKLGWEEYKKHRMQRRVEAASLPNGHGEIISKNTDKRSPARQLQVDTQEFDAICGKGTAKKIDKIMEDYDPLKEEALDNQERAKLNFYLNRWLLSSHTVSVKDYCAIHDLPLTKFKYWARRGRRELKKNASEGGI